MSKNKFGLVFRMESEGAGNVGEVTADSTLAAEAGVTEAAEQVESATGDVTEVVTGIENASEASEELSSVQDSLEEAVESGEGVSPREAEHIQARLERVASLLGTTTTDMGLTFRRESFGGSNSRLAATKMRLEFVKEWGKKIWELIQKAWEWVKGVTAKLLESISGSADRLQERLKALQAQVLAAQSKGRTIGTDKIKSKAGVFSIDGVTSADTIKKFVSLTDEYNVVVHNVTKLMAPASIEKIAKTGDLKEHSKTIVDAFTKGPMVGTLPKSAGERAIGALLLPNNKAVVSTPVAVKSGEEEIEILELSIAQANEKSAEEYSPLSFDEMKTILSSALDSVSSLADYQKVKKELDAITKANISYAETMAKAASSIDQKNSEDDAGKKTAAATAAKVKALHDMSVKAISISVKNLPSASFTILAAVGDVVAASLSSGKDPEKK